MFPIICQTEKGNKTETNRLDNKTDVYEWPAWEEAIALGDFLWRIIYVFVAANEVRSSSNKRYSGVVLLEWPFPCLCRCSGGDTIADISLTNNEIGFFSFFIWDPACVNLGPTKKSFNLLSTLQIFFFLFLFFFFLFYLKGVSVYYPHCAFTSPLKNLCSCTCFSRLRIEALAKTSAGILWLFFCRGGTSILVSSIPTQGDAITTAVRSAPLSFVRKAGPEVRSDGVSCSCED